MNDTKEKIYLKDSGIGGSSILTIKRKIMIALISVLSVFLILTSIVLVKKLSGTSKRNAVVKLYDSSKNLGFFIETIIKNVYDTNKTLAKTFESFQDIPPENRRSYFNSLQKEILSLLSSSSDKILRYATSLVKNAGSFFLSLVFFAFALYFFYVDGAYLFSLLKHAIPIENETSNKLFSKIGEITTNLFKGLFLVSFYQGDGFHRVVE